MLKCIDSWISEEVAGEVAEAEVAVEAGAEDVEEGAVAAVNLSGPVK